MMRRREFVLGVVLFAIAACQRQAEQAEEPAPEAAIPDPAAVIAPLYERYRTDPAVTTFPALLEQAPWSAELRGQLEAMTARSQANEEPTLDFDPFINAQDWLVTAVTVTTDAVVANSHATVRARFTNLAAEDEVVYDLVWEGGAWRVNNMRHANWDLRQIINQGA
jgi:hypothetical protein